MLEVSAGAILYTLVDKQILYLLIHDHNGNFGFPKGHQEEGEDLEETARREVWEEVSIDAEFLPGFKRSIFYTLPNGNNKQVVFFLGRFFDQEPEPLEGEVKEVVLLPYKKAREAITFLDTKMILDSAHQIVLKEVFGH